jgi:SAM-dependent methyltransferase
MSLPNRQKFRIWTPLFLHQKLLRIHITEQGKQILDLLRLQFPGQRLRILDVGCGQRPYSEYFSGTDIDYLGADIPWANVQADFDINPTTGEVQAPVESFHAIVHFQALEHVPNANALLLQTQRLLKAGGYMFCTVPFVFEYHPVPGDYRRWTTDGLKLDLELAGFKVHTTQNVEADLPALLTVLELFIAARLGYKITKPMFLLLNIVGWLGRDTRKSVFPLTVSALAQKLSTH